MSDLIDQMEQIGVVKRSRLEVYHPQVRDRQDVVVLRDSLTEVIILSRSDHIDETYYQEKGEPQEAQFVGLDVNKRRSEDNIRRAREFGSFIRNKHWLDYGCGLGGMLDELAANAKTAIGYDPNLQRARIVEGKGYTMVDRLEDINDQSIDTVTLFHVLEHLTNPVESLQALRRILKPSGSLLIEIPHARDALFSLYDCEAFKNFTFWSEHLILHTRESLTAVLEKAGFSHIQISGYQRYPLANHLYWLACGKGGGQNHWDFLSNQNLNEAYHSTLDSVDRTDSLIAIATANKPED